MSYEYKIYHKETGEEIHEENFSQYFSQYIALDSDGDLVEIDSRDAVVVSVVDFAYIKFNKTDEYEAKAKAYDSLKNNLEKEVGILTGEVSGFPYVDAPIESAISHFEHVLEMMKKYESGELNAEK